MKKTLDILPADSPARVASDAGEDDSKLSRKALRRKRLEAKQRAEEARRDLAASKPVVAAEDKPPLLLHTCCAPCSTSVIEQLEDRFDIRSYWFNPNIQPREEFDRRLEENRRYAQALEMPFAVEETHVKHWFERMKGVERAPEGGERCVRCYEMRLEWTAEAAVKQGIPYVASVMSVSPFKVSREINRIGTALGDEMGFTFVDEDFKKRDGFKRSLELSDALGLYRQDYCGCVFQMREIRERRRERAAERERALTKSGKMKEGATTSAGEGSALVVPAEGLSFS